MAPPPADRTGARRMAADRFQERLEVIEATRPVETVHVSPAWGTQADFSSAPPSAAFEVHISNMLSICA